MTYTPCCADCGTPIDPENFIRERGSVLCLPCADDRDAATLSYAEAPEL